MAMKVDLMDNQDVARIIGELRELRDGMEVASWALFERAREIEQNETRSWSGFFASFDALLDFGNIMRPARYRNWCKAVDDLGKATVREIGLQAAEEIVRMAPPREVVEEVVEHCKLSRQANGVGISAQQAKNVIDRLDTRKKQSGLAQARDRELSAAEENVVLKKRIVELEREVANLSEENAELRERLLKEGVPKGVQDRGARKPSAKPLKRKRS